ncbi:MAG: discoidin domain-containing protein [Deltaproteobacteria bacterium]|nr:discoidin domain-containing protein [Deltaproteobacteria bacterium]
MPNKPSRMLALIFLAAAIVRVIPLLTAQLWRDEAVVGIMSLRVLAGDFPVFFYGQNFMGALEAYLGAVGVLLFGAQAWVLEGLAVILSLLFLFLIWQLGRRMFPSGVVRTALVYLALPPVFLLDWAHEARPHYPLTLIFGTLLALIAVRVIYCSPSRAARPGELAALGILAGLGWWTNHLIVVYLLPVFFFLWLHDKKLPLRQAFLLLIIFFLAGQLPQLLYQSRQPEPSLSIIELIVWPDWKTIAVDLFGNALPILGGVPYPLSTEPGKWLPYLVFAVIGGVSLIYVLINRRSALAGLLRLNPVRTKGVELLGLVFIATLGVNCLTVFNIRLSDNDQKYLLPVYTCLPFFLAFFINRVDQRFRGAGFLLVGLLLVCNLWGILAKPGWPLLDRERRRAIRQEAKIDAALLQALQERGISRLYAADDLSLRLTFLSAERIIATDPYQSVSLRYSRWVDGTSGPAYLLPGPQTDWEHNLQALGGHWRKTILAGGFALYTDFIPPPGPFVPLPHSGWKAADQTFSPEAAKAFDGDIGSSWQARQQVGRHFILDLGRKETIGKVAWWPGDYPEVPGGYQVEVSEMGKEWQVVTRIENYRGPFFWSGPGPMIKIRRGRVEACFTPVSARFVRLTLLSGRPGGIWSINEILIYKPGEGWPAVQVDSKVLGDLWRFLEEGKIRQVLGDPWLSALIHNYSAGKIRTLIFNHFLDDNGGRYPPPAHFYPLKINPDLALIMDRAEQHDGEAALLRNGVSYQVNDFGPYRVYSRLVKPPLMRLPRSGWRLTANANPEDLHRAMDGKIDSRWTSLRPQTPGLAIQMDLGRLETVEGVILKLGGSRRDYPRDLHISVSPDGKSWLEPEARWSSELYWAGTRLFTLYGDQVVYTFSPVSCRYLKLEQRGSDPDYYWSIHELDLIAGQPVSRTR